jgi:tripartite-type tricarboxylate transporter receptor subunit TctC
MIACRTVLAMAAAMVIAPLLLAPGVARADWPDRPIKWVVPFGPGGANEAGLFAPKGTPPAIVERMSKELEAAVKSAEFRDKMVPSGIEPEPGTTASFIVFISAERDRLGSLAKKANMRADK